MAQIQALAGKRLSSLISPPPGQRYGGGQHLRAGPWKPGGTGYPRSSPGGGRHPRPPRTSAEELENYGRREASMPENKKRPAAIWPLWGVWWGFGVKMPLAPVMVAAVLLGVTGFLCAIFITVLGAYALLDSILPGMPSALAPFACCCRCWPSPAACCTMPSRAAIILSPFKLLAPSSGIRSCAAPAGPGELGGRDRDPSGSPC